MTSCNGTAHNLSNAGWFTGSVLRINNYRFIVETKLANTYILWEMWRNWVAEAVKLSFPPAGDQFLYAAASMSGDQAEGTGANRAVDRQAKVLQSFLSVGK
jgi:hypothetical protein